MLRFLRQPRESSKPNVGGEETIRSHAFASRCVYAEDMEKRDKLSQVPNSP